MRSALGDAQGGDVDAIDDWVSGRASDGAAFTE
jgi:hypothetical protein